MEVKNPGELVPPVTLDLLRQRKPVHASRNPLIVRLLADLGLMREEGEGIPRIFDEMEGSFLQPPEFTVEAGEFMVILRNEPTFTGPSQEWQDIVQTMPLSVAQKRILLARPEGFANEDYRHLNKVDRDQAYREIQDMVSKGMIMPAEAPGRGAFYHIAPDLREAEAFLQARLPRLREYFAARKYLTNAAFREMFQVPRVRAVRELNRLVREGYLKLQGKGRGARYVPGPGLETSARVGKK